MSHPHTTGYGLGVQTRARLRPPSAPERLRGPPPTSPKGATPAARPPRHGGAKPVSLGGFRLSATGTANVEAKP
eukprot:3130503-Prymnesium_polylepis.1